MFSWDGADFLPGVVERDFVILFVDANEFADESSAGEEAVHFPAHVARCGDLADDLARRIVDGRKLLRTGPGAGPEPAEWRTIADGFVRPDGVVDLASPDIEIALEVFERVTANAGPEFAFERAVQPFDLALSLGMPRASMNGMDA